MESAEGVELLLDVGLDRRVTGSAEVEIATGGRWSSRRVLLLRHSPSPQEIGRAVAALPSRFDGLLFVVARAGRALARAAETDHRVAYAAVDDAVVYLDGEAHRAAEDRPATGSHPGRTSWARLGLLRLFALSPGDCLTQSEIARRLGFSHVAVGKQLPLLDGLVEQTATGWRAIDRAECWNGFLGGYPGPRGLTTYWAANEDVAAQLERVEQIGRERGEALPAVSGDFAADFFAPWRRPGHVVAYVSAQPALQEHGFATVRSGDATVELRTPKDPTILAMSREWPSTRDKVSRRYVDPLITAWDLRRSSGGDIDSAIDQLRERALREPLWT